MNNYVYFKPTQLGKKVYIDYYKKWYDVNSNSILAVDKDGYAKLQFHNFIAIYGTCITHYYSVVDEVFEAYEFYIDEENLDEVHGLKQKINKVTLVYLNTEMLFIDILVVVKVLVSLLH